MNVLKKALLSYQQFLSKYPAPVQIVQTGILMGVGDIQSQLLFEDKTLKTLDKLRVLKFSALGFCFIGPVLCNWYKLLHVTVQGEPNIVTLKKVALDQIVAAPSLLLCVTSGISLLDGHSIQETKQILKDTYFTILLANYKVWPLVQLVNFAFVPLNYQVFFVQTVAIFWNTFLSYKTHQGSRNIKEKGEKSQK